MGGFPRAHDSVGTGAPKSYDVTGGDVVRVEQSLVFGPAPEERITGVSGVLQDRTDGAALPPVGQPVAVLIGSAGRRARDAVAVQPSRDRPVPLALEVLGKDPAYDLSRCLINER